MLETLFDANQRQKAVKQFKARLGIKNVTWDLALIYAYKQLYQRVWLSRPHNQKILAVMGCQRSGTSLMTRVFERDVNAKVYRESSKLSSQDPEELKLNPLDSVYKTISRNKAPLIVLKPLVESQNATNMLDVMPNARVLWMYRHYLDVTASYLKAFGQHSGIRDLRIIVNQESNNWRSEKVSAETRALIQSYFSEDMNSHDALALFWYARNKLYFEQSLETNERVLLCRYDYFAQQPVLVMKRIYAFLDLPYPGDQIGQDVRASSVGKGRRVNLLPDVAQLCEEMWAKLNRIEETQR